MLLLLLLLLLLLPALTSRREMVESDSDVIIDAAASGKLTPYITTHFPLRVPGNAAFLVVGDAFGATTHTDLYIRARERGVEVKVDSSSSSSTSSASSM